MSREYGPLQAVQGAAPSRRAHAALWPAPEVLHMPVPAGAKVAGKCQGDSHAWSLSEGMCEKCPSAPSREHGRGVRTGLDVLGCAKSALAKPSGSGARGCRGGMPPVPLGSPDDIAPRCCCRTAACVPGAPPQQHLRGASAARPMRSTAAVRLSRDARAAVRLWGWRWERISCREAGHSALLSTSTLTILPRDKMFLPTGELLWSKICVGSNPP